MIEVNPIVIGMSLNYAVDIVDGAQAQVLRVNARRIKLSDVCARGDPLPIDSRVVHRGVERGDELLGGHRAASAGEVRVGKSKAAAGLTSH